MKLLLIAINAKYIHSSLSIRYLKTYCDKLPCEIKLTEFTINNHLLEIADQIFDEFPDILGIDCYIWNIELIKKLLPLIKKMLPHTKIICGGPEVSYKTKEFMTAFPIVDYVIRGEGEKVLFSLLKNILADTSTTDIPGLAQYTEEKTIQESFPVVLANLNELPFPYTDSDIKQLGERIIYYESSRGCPFSCKYCLSCATKGVRYRSLDKVLKELSFFVRHNVKQVKFVDRTFNASKKHFLPILEFLAKQNCRTNFHFEAAIDYLDTEALSILQRMPPGRVQLEIGIQSTNTETLQQINRTNHWQKIVNNINAIKSFENIHIHADLIIGLPLENIVSFEKSFNTVYQLYPHMLQVGFLKLLKGSAMENLVKPHRYKFMDTAPYEVLANKYLSVKEIRQLRIFVDVFEVYYNSGRFSLTLQYLINKNNFNAFSFFTSLASFWHIRLLDKASHSPKALYKYLNDFASNNKSSSPQILDNLLRFDALSSDQGHFRPLFLNWSEKDKHSTIKNFWKNTPVVKKYITAYVFADWRTIRNNYHIEYFSIDILHFAETHEIIDNPCIILFIYNGLFVKKIPMKSGDLK
ncbi:B12-binding domain-containing radical SAM protein [Pectinatus sottacetonis]|uniref:B12-binding domain-containing radical SAM protein n=1 Tax=Pectinatus sottacetonis TaxID=1002795 RepID=UPI0018C5BEBE|nr:B12-binding domain-containing radical SAM protein [Pectinatus sottacetonis]